MKITSGWAKNLALRTPEGLSTRPTRTRVREAVLSSLQNELEGASVIDCFAGSGAMGLEMLSRGAISCLFLDSGSAALNCLRLNRDALLLRAKGSQANPPEIQIGSTDLFTSDSKWNKSFAGCDLLWVDPPYERAIEWLGYFLTNNQLYPKKNAMLILELRSSDHPRAVELIERSPQFSLKKMRTYGETTIMYTEYLGEV